MSSAIFVNVIEVDPEQHDQLIELLHRGLNDVIAHRSGFVSASILTSLDRTRVINIAHWQTAADIETLRTDPSATTLAAKIAALGHADAAVYTVAHRHTPQPS